MMARQKRQLQRLRGERAKLEAGLRSANGLIMHNYFLDKLNKIDREIADLEPHPSQGTQP